MKRILITGGSGFLGVALANRLKEKYSVFLGSRNNKKNFEAQEKTGCPVFSLDVSNIESIRDTVNLVRPDIIIHAAATKFVDISEKFPLDCVDVNVVGSQNVARVAIDSGVKYVIGISTDKAAPPVRSTYGMSKAIMEKMFCALDGETKFMCVRYGNVAWSTGSVFTKWKELSDSGSPIVVCNPDMRRFFFDVEDAVSLVVDAIKNIDKFHGKIVTREMKSESMGNIAQDWGRLYDCDVIVSNDRPGERVDEFLLGEIELQYSEKIGDKIVITPNVKSKKPIRNIISTANAQKMSEDDIMKLLRK